jgi:hypothetical protein
MPHVLYTGILRSPHPLSLNLSNPNLRCVHLLPDWVMQDIAVTKVSRVDIGVDVLTLGGLVLGVDVGDIHAVNALAGTQVPSLCRCPTLYRACCSWR